MKKAYLRFFTIIAMLVFCAALMAITKAGQIRVFDVSPNPMDLHTLVTLEFTEPVNASVNIEDRYGNVVRNLHSGAIDKAIQLPWERYDDFGNYVPNGKYWVVVNYDSRYTSTKKTLILK